MTGQIGIDEGGILQALATPILHREVTKTKKLKKGGEKVTKTTFEVTGAHVIAAMLGSAFLAWLVSGGWRGADGALLTDEERDALTTSMQKNWSWTALFPVAGATKTMWDAYQQTQQPDETTATGRRAAADKYTQDSLLKYQAWLQGGMIGPAPALVLKQ